VAYITLDTLYTVFFYIIWCIGEHTGKLEVNGFPIQPNSTS